MIQNYIVSLHAFYGEFDKLKKNDFKCKKKISIL